MRRELDDIKNSTTYNGRKGINGICLATLRNSLKEVNKWIILRFRLFCRYIMEKNI